jgi:tetratricopeptide (TPR) repeat protein
LGVGLVFGQTVMHDFVNYDDPQYVTANMQVKHGMSVEGVVWAFAHRHASNWHPLTWISHMLDWQVYGRWAGGHHLTNLLLHAATSVGLFLLLKRMTGRLWPSALVAALFAVHPLRVESVAWVAERKDLLAGLFFVLTLWAYVEYVARPFSVLRYLLVVLCFALGLMAKPMLVTLPALLLLLDYWPLGRLKPSADVHGPRPAIRALVEKLPLLAVVGMSCAVTLWAQRQTMVGLEHLSLSARFANAAVAYVAYLGKFFCPVQMAVLYPLPPGGFPAWVVAAACGILAGISVAVVAARRSHPYLLVGWLWYLGMLVPVIGIVQVGRQVMADRYTLLPQIGLCIALVWGGAEIVGSSILRRRVATAIAALLLAALTASAWQQTTYWRNSVTLWTHALECAPENYIAHYNMGEALLKTEHYPEAIEHFGRALQFQPGDADVYLSRGNVFLASGRVSEAVADYREALHVRPDFAKAHAGLASALTKLGHLPEAIEHGRDALRLDPNCVETHDSLGVALFEAGRLDEAMEQYRQAFQIDPDDVGTLNNLGNAMTRLGRPKEAIGYYELVLHFQPDHASAHSNLGNALTEVGRIPEAIEHCQAAVRSKPDYPEAYYNWGNALLDAGRMAEAIDQYEQALRFQPDFVDAQYNLGLCLVGIGRQTEAVEHFRHALRLAEAARQKAKVQAARNQLRQLGAGGS